MMARAFGYSVQVTAESMFEAAALALQIFEGVGTPPGPAAHLEIAAQSPVVNHSVQVRRVRDWLTSGGKSPRSRPSNRVCEMRRNKIADEGISARRSRLL